MTKLRVYELARELDLESKVVLARAQELGLEVKTASSGLDEDSAALVRLSYEETATPQPAAAPDENGASASVAVEPDLPEASEPVVPADAVAEPVHEIEEPPPAPVAEPPSVGAGRSLTVEKGITAHELARLIGVRTGDIVRQLLSMGEMVPGAGTIPGEAIVPLGDHFGWAIHVEEAQEEPEEEDEPFGPHLVSYEDDPSTLEPRPPVVTVMGHVDHGKTQLLDSIRSANVVAGEAGGITQHIGAYQVTRNGDRITFIDTPGHEAFTALRARGANVTDIAIIVVAADDGVMPQTVEAIDHAIAAGVPMIIAINKMDLEAADPFSVRGALTQHGVVVEELGGEVVSAEISALTGDGIDHLLDMLSIVAEVEELKANPKAPAVGTVIEAQLEVGRGPVGTAVVHRGTLRRGDILVAGPVSGRVRAMFDESGNQVREAGPSTPVLVMGWDEVPTAGDMFEVVKNERMARKQAQARADDIRSRDLVLPTATERLMKLLESLRDGEQTELRIVLKADAHGSLEAIRDALGKIKRDDASVRLIHGAVGGITSNDVMLAEASEGVIYGFNTRPDAGARSGAKSQGIDIRTFNIIYELLDDVEGLLVGELAPDEVETFLGVADVRAVFRAPRFGFVAGSYVTEGTINRNASARVVRDGVVVYDGRIASLRRFKDDVQSVQNGFECGIGLENFRDVKEGDTIESYEIRQVART
ncbi:MAG: translation initiation factor IF-2 [Acidimicrobiia bacterium]